MLNQHKEKKKEQYQCDENNHKSDTGDESNEE